MSNIPYYKIAIIVSVIQLFAVFGALGNNIKALAEVGTIAETTPSLLFEEDSWDFGDIKEDGGEVAHSFVFTNTSAKPVVILDVSASCGCTSPYYSRKPIMPGAKGEVKVVFDPMNRPGNFSKGVVVALSTKERITLTIRGNVLPRELTIEESYPFEVGDGVRLNSNFHAFSYLGRGEEATETILVYNTSRKDATLELRPKQMSNMLQVEVPKIIKAQGFAAIKLRYVVPAASKRYGLLDDVFNIVVNGKESRTLLSTHAIAVDKYDPAIDDMSMPSCELSKKIIKFGDVKHGSKVEDNTIEIENIGNAELIIRAVEWKSQALGCSLRAGDRLAVGEKCKITFTLDTSDSDYGVWLDRVSIITNDAERPMQTLRVTAVVVD